MTVRVDVEPGGSRNPPDGHANLAPTTSLARDRLGRALTLTLTVILAVVAAVSLVTTAQSPFGQTFAGTDLTGYLDGARRFLATGSPYQPEQLVPWSLADLGAHAFIHPPTALALFVPFLALPSVLWWLIPIAITTWGIARLRPALWTWPLMALMLCWPRSSGSLVVGNTDMWVAAFLAAGATLGWPLALLIIKPTFAPLAAIGIRDRRTWIGVAVVGAASLLLLPLWFEWWAVITNAALSPGYSLLNLPLPLVPVIAWMGRASR